MLTTLIHRMLRPLVLALTVITPAVAYGTDGAWPALATEKVFPGTLPSTEWPAAWMQAGQGDIEGTLIAARSEGGTTVPATVTDLTGPNGVIPAAGIERFQVGTVPLSRPSTGVDVLLSSDYPDPLIPLTGALQVPAGRTTALYLRVHVPPDAASGRYQGDVDMGSLGRVPVWLDVFAVPITRAGGYQTVARLETIALARATGVNDVDRSLVDGVYSDLLPMLRDHAVSPGKAPFSDPQVNASTWEMDFADRPEAGRYASTDLARFIGLGFPWVEVPFEVRVPTAPEVRDGAFAEDARRRAQARSIGQRFSGGAARPFALPIDEPGESQYPAVARAAGQLHQEAPGVDVMVTEAPKPTALAAMGDAVDIWAPPVWDYYLYRDRLADLRAKGKRTWWYTYGSDTQRFTMNVLIDKPTTESRVAGWLAAEQGVGGAFYYSLDSWVKSGVYQDPWTDPWYVSHVKDEEKCGGTARTVGGNGEASIIYPTGNPARPALGSLRLEALRDGVEDNVLLLRLQAEQPAYAARIFAGLSHAFSGANEGFDACKPQNRPPYLPVIETDPRAIMGGRYAAFLKLTGGTLVTLRGRVVSGGRAVAGARVRFGLFETTTRKDGRWSMPEVTPVCGTLLVASRDTEGLVDPSSVPVTGDACTGGAAIDLTLRGRRERAIFPTRARLRVFLARAKPASVRIRGNTVRMHIERSYTSVGREINGGRIIAPEVQAVFPSGAAGRRARNWSGWKYMEFDMTPRNVGPSSQPWRLVVTPGRWQSARYLLVGQGTQHLRLSLKGLPLRDVRYLRFGLESALPVSKRANQRPRADLMVRNIILTK